MKYPVWWVWFPGLAAMALAMAPPAETPSPQSAPPIVSETVKKGKELFADNCFVCHDRDSDRVKPLGPSLNGLFKRKTLIAGKAVTDENVKEAIRLGSTPGMPAFRYQLSAEETSDIVEFLKTK
jgi:mono/diheme cytochrome c family protein